MSVALRFNCGLQRVKNSAINPAVISDQFAFKPTGSTTSALTFYMHHVNLLDS